MGVRSHGAGNLSQGNSASNRCQPLMRPAKLVVHQGHLQAEGGWFGVNAVAAPHHRRELEAQCLFSNDLPQFFQIFQKQIGRGRHLKGKGGVDHVAAGQAEVKPTTGGRADVFRDVGGKSKEVVLQRALQFPTTSKRERGFLPHCLKIFGGHHSLLRQGFGDR